MSGPHPPISVSSTPLPAHCGRRPFSLSRTKGILGPCELTRGQGKDLSPWRGLGTLIGAAVLPAVEGSQSQERGVGSPSREGRWGHAKYQDRAQRRPPLSLVEGSLLPHKLGKPGLLRGRVAEGLETASEKIKLHLRANSIRE